MYCKKCGAQNDDNNFKCTSCGQILHPPQQPPAQADDYTLGVIVPYKNSFALIAYYLGVFSIIPFLGILLGIAAFILGLKGLQFAKNNPEAKGKAHAWIGILAGGFFSLVYLTLTLFMLIG
jgi:hypothetical protein